MSEKRASELAEGNTYYDFDSGEQYIIARIGYHGDAVLVTTPDGTELTLDRDHVVEVLG